VSMLGNNLLCLGSSNTRPCDVLWAQGNRVISHGCGPCWEGRWRVVGITGLKKGRGMATRFQK